MTERLDKRRHGFTKATASIAAVKSHQARGPLGGYARQRMRESQRKRHARERASR